MIQCEILRDVNSGEWNRLKLYFEVPDKICAKAIFTYSDICTVGMCTGKSPVQRRHSRRSLSEFCNRRQILGDNADGLLGCD